MSAILDELRQTIRRIGRAPRFSVPVILVLAIGIGVNGALLSLAEALLHRPLSVPRPEELVAVVTYNTAQDYYGSISIPDYGDYRRRNSAVEDLAGYVNRDLTLRVREETERISGQLVSENFFPVLEVPAAYGRLIDSRAPGSPEGVLGFEFWQRRFGGDPAILGEVVYLDRHPLTVVGIAQKGFRGVDPEAPADLWIPLDAYAAVQSGFEGFASNRGSQMLTCLGRLRSGVDLRRAERDLAVLASNLAADHPESHADWTVRVLPAENGVIEPARRKETVRLLAIFGAATGLLLAIICASVTSLLLAQAMGRGPEVAVRLALGSPRRLLLRSFATEYVVLALLGGGIGLVLARGVLSILSAFRPSEFLPIAEGLEFQVSGSVVAAVLLLSLLAAAVSSVVPVFHMLSIDLRSELGSRATVATARRRRLWSVFVMAQVGLSTVLLIGAGLMFESWHGLSAIDLGFDPREVTLLSLDLRAAGYGEASGIELYQTFQERLASRPGVGSVSLATVLPLGRRGFMKQIAVDGYELNSKGWTHSLTGNVVSPGYFRTVGIPLLMGRDFGGSDSRNGPGAAIVNETLARTIWPGQEAVGKTFRFVHQDGEFPVEVVGLVRDTWHLRDRRSRYGPHFYLPLAQHYQPRMTALVKAGLPATGVAEMAAAELRRLDPDLALHDVTTFPEVIDSSLARERTAMALLGATSLLALLLAGFGLYATLSYLVARRTAEIGLRIALGARPVDIVTLVLGRSLVLTGAGLVLGLVAATWASGLLAHLLYEVDPLDPSVYLGVAVVVAGLSLFASYLPARRALRIHPAASLMQGT